MTAGQTSLAEWVPIVRGEFLEIPGLHLTKRQIQRLWGLDAAMCDALVAAGFLRQTHKGGYARADGGGQ